MRMVIKFPTRGRPEKFAAVLNKYINFLSGMHEVHFVVSFDHDDPSMNNDNMWSLFSRLNSQLDGRIHPVCGKSTGKISAVNADLDVVRRLNPDVILLASDDMIPIHGGYDDVIARAMAKFFPDTDGVLWFNDGFSGGNKLITLSILGRKYFERFATLVTSLCSVTTSSRKWRRCLARLCSSTMSSFSTNGWGLRLPMRYMRVTSLLKCMNMTSRCLKRVLQETLT